jgi:L-malate glycosyltransferase
MKICFLADGASIHTHRWVTPLIDRGYAVHVASYRPISHGVPGAEFVDLTKLSNTRKFRFLSWAWWLRGYLADLNPDILHAHQIQAAGWLGAMSRFHPFIVSSWGSDLLIEPHKSVLRRTLVRSVLKTSDRLIVPSRLVAQAAYDLGYPTSKTHLIPWGVETDIFRPNPDDRSATRQQLGFFPDTKVILSPRSLARLYNHDILLEAISALRSRIPNVLLVLLRYNIDPLTATRLEAQVTELGLEQHVRWLSPQTSAELAQLYRAADVVASIPSSEGYGFTVYEAMAAGCPTLITDLPVYTDELVDGVHTLKVPVRDVVATSQRLYQLLTDDSLARKLHARALDIAQAHNVSQRISQADALYRELTKQHAGQCPVGEAH